MPASAVQLTKMQQHECCSLALRGPGGKILTLEYAEHPTIAGNIEGAVKWLEALRYLVVTLPH